MQLQQNGHKQQHLKDDFKDYLTTFLVPRDRNASRKHNRFYIENA